ncbi:MAG: RNA polymerase sigma factor [Sphingomonas sp.]|nr:RNA polymerase sigma factor [Sphingomonas sp.]
MPSNGQSGVAERNDEDLALSRRAAAGDSAAFATLVEKHEAPLRAFLARMGAADIADDVAQEAFLRAWRAAGQYDGSARYSTWLTSIAWRCRLDELRRRPRAHPADAVELATDGPSSEVADMLARLSDKERAALVLCEGHGWTHSEASEMLGLPLGTLKSTVARAKMKCREMWSGAGHD